MTDSTEGSGGEAGGTSSAKCCGCGGSGRDPWGSVEEGQEEEGTKEGEEDKKGGRGT